MDLNVGAAAELRADLAKASAASLGPLLSERVGSSCHACSKMWPRLRN